MRTPPDGQDVALIRTLQRDGRASLQALADHTGLSRTAVRVRVRRLLDSGTVRVVGIAHAQLVGMGSLAHARLGVTGSASGLAARIAERPASTFVSLTVGRAAVVCEFRGPDEHAIAAELAWLRGQPEVLWCDPFHSQQRVRDAYAADGPMRPVKLDDVDWRLLDALQRDGRVPYAALAQRVGLSQAAARARVIRLVEAGAVRIRALVDPAGLDPRESAGIGVSTTGSSLVVAEALAELDEAFWVFAGIGTADVICSVETVGRRGLQELLDLIRSRDDVRELEAWGHLHVVKESYVVDLEAVPGRR